MAGSKSGPEMEEVDYCALPGRNRRTVEKQRRDGGRVPSHENQKINLALDLRGVASHGHRSCSQNRDANATHRLVLVRAHKTPPILAICSPP
jgi:hypothetical protein